MMKKLFYIACITLICLGCREYNPPEIDMGKNPIFYFSGTVQGTQVQLRADGSHVAQSGFTEDSLGVTYYEGALAECKSCDPVIAMHWRTDNLDQPDLNNTVMEGNPAIRYIQNRDTQVIYDITLTAKPSGEVVSYTWTILGETYFSEQVDLSVKMDEDLTHFPATLEVEDSNGCAATITDTVYLPHHGCDCAITSRKLDSTLYEFTAHPQGGSSYDYAWKFEEGSEASSKEVTFHFDGLPADDVESVFLSIETNGCRANRIFNQYFSNSSSSCAVNFNYSIENRNIVVPAPTAIDLGEIELVYLHSDGSLYYSNLVEQDQSSSFNVISIEEYSDAFVGADKRSIKVEAAFNCLMSNGTNTIRFSDGRLTLPIGLGAE